MKRSVRILISTVLLVAGLLCSCGNTELPPAETQSEQSIATEAVSEPETEYRYTPQRTDYGKAEFRIICYDNTVTNGWHGIPNDIASAEDPHADVLSEAVYTRNMHVEEQLQIRIIGTTLAPDQVYSTVSNATMADFAEFDAVFPGIHQLSSMVSNQLLSDLHDTDIQFSDPWWDQNSIESFELGGVLFGVVSDITFYDKISTYVTFFNTEMLAAHKLENPYDLVTEGEWTLDKLLEMGEAASMDINNDDIYNEEDAYGLAFQNDASYVLLNAANHTIITKDENGLPVYHLKDESVLLTLQRIYGLMLDSRRFFNRQDFGLDLQAAINMFVEDRVMFMIRPIQSLFMMRQMDADFGIVTLPKMNVEDEYAGSAVNPYSGTLMVMPTVVQDKARTADVLQALACESYYTVTEPLYDVVLGAALVRDERASEMLGTAFDNRVYDIGMVFNFGGLSNDLLSNRTTNISSKIKAWERKVNQKIDELTQQIEIIKGS